MLAAFTFGAGDIMNSKLVTYKGAIEIETEYMFENANPDQTHTNETLLRKGVWFRCERVHVRSLCGCICFPIKCHQV